MKGWAISLLHISLEEFGLLHLSEFWSAMEAYSEERKMDRQHIAELVRGATLRLWNLQVDPKYRINRPSDFWAMPYDDTDASDEVQYLNSCSDEERTRLAREYMESIKHITHGTAKKRTDL